ncbi:hypothetical protein [uncultured Sphaerochaeta sp.]|nr:hypothetical protein [uncultured Sphaerochaeta sp.]
MIADRMVSAPRNVRPKSVVIGIQHIALGCVALVKALARQKDG